MPHKTPVHAPKAQRFASPALAMAGWQGSESKQAALLLQEEMLQQGEGERRLLLEKVSALERSLHAAEGERRAAQVGTGVKNLPLPP